MQSVAEVVVGVVVADVVVALVFLPPQPAAAKAAATSNTEPRLKGFLSGSFRPFCPLRRWRAGYDASASPEWQDSGLGRMMGIRTGTRMRLGLGERARWSAGLAAAVCVGVAVGRLVERRRMLASAAAIARTDPLTGLANRRAWEEELRREVARARRNSERLALVMLDLDHFKELNDTQGHQAGDTVLAEAAASWRTAVRTTDFLARYGGDEFAMLLPDCPDEYGETVLERIRTAIPPGCSCSAGIAYWDGNESAEDLLARADAALYEAKRAGRNTAVTAGDGSGD